MPFNLGSSCPCCASGSRGANRRAFRVALAPLPDPPVAVEVNIDTALYVETVREYVGGIRTIKRRGDRARKRERRGVCRVHAVLGACDNDLDLGVDGARNAGLMLILSYHPLILLAEVGFGFLFHPSMVILQVQ